MNDFIDNLEDNIDMGDDAFQLMREEALRYAFERNKRLIEGYCRECGVTEPVGYEHNYDGIMTIYTNRPGYFIGKGGEKVRHFEQVLTEEYHRDYKVKFVEVRGGFVNFNKEDMSV